MKMYADRAQMSYPKTYHMECNKKLLPIDISFIHTMNTLVDWIGVFDPDLSVELSQKKLFLDSTQESTFLPSPMVGVVNMYP